MSSQPLTFIKRRVSRRTVVSSEEVMTTALQDLAGQEGEQFWQLLVGVFDNLKRGMIVTDRNGRVVVFNETAQQIMGYRAAEVIGQVALWDFCEECERPPLFRESLLRGQGFPDEEVEMTRKDGQGGPIGVKVTGLYSPQRELIGALATLRSLDELRARERERKSLVRMASIGRIISAVAHEINNPLQTVRTSIELGLDPRKSADRRQHYLRAAEQEVSRIAHIIGQMRDFYRPDPGDKQPTDVNQTLRDALSLLDLKFSQAGIELKLELSVALPKVSLIDYQLEQVFLNLGLNALEAMPDGGHLTVRSWLEDDQSVVITFQDSAAVSQPQPINLFDPFAPHGRVGALALGLSVSQEIISEMGGSIEVHPADAGRVVVRLPI